MIGTSWLVVPLLVILILLRSAYRFLAPSVIDRDAYAHMLYARDIRQHGHRLPTRPSKAVTSGEYGYPFLMHWLLSFVPPTLYRSIDRHFSPLMDVLFALLILGLVPLGVADQVEAAGMITIFVITPQSMRPDLPNAIGLSGRKPGMILAVSSFLLFGEFVASGSLLTLGISVLLGALVFLASKFSIQAFVAVAVAWGLLIDPWGFGLVALAFGTAVLVTAGAYIPVFEGYLRFLYEYGTVKQYKTFDAIVLDPRKIVAEITSVADALRVTHRNRVVRPLANNPYIIAAALGIGLEYITGIGITLSPAYRVWLLACAVMFVTTSLPHMLFLGKAERYLEYAFVPASLVILRSWSAFGDGYRLTVSLVLLGGVGMIGVYIWSYQRFFRRPSKEAAWSELIDVLRSQRNGTVLMHPFYGARRIAWETDHVVVDCILNEGPTDDDEMAALFPDKYAYVTTDVGWLAAQYDPDWVVFDHRKLHDEGNVGLRPPDVEPVFANDHFELYRFGDVVSTDNAM